ncbi:MAG: serine hydrolase [Lachnospiraceae bacterium]|nr:serine hydrolase [Lachnospiraceae bacterium]
MVKKKKKKRSAGAAESRFTEKQLWLITLLLLIVIGAGACLLLVVFTASSSRRLEMPFRWTNEAMVYNSTDQTAMQTRTSYTSDLCITDKDVSNSEIQVGDTVHAALFSLDDRKVVYSKGIFEKVYPASITKLLTAIMALESDKMDETVTINWQDLELESGSQVVGFRIGDKVTMRELLRGLLVHSGNDAAQAIARSVGGTQDKFVKMMNEKLQELGCTGSHFMNPTGLHDENHYTTVYDIYLMLNEAMKYDDFVNITQISVYDLQYQDADGNEKHVTLDSTDHYLTGTAEPPKNVTVLGGKTGTTSAAGNCLALYAQNAYGQFYISIVVGASSKDQLYEDHNTLLSRIND